MRKKTVLEIGSKYSLLTILEYKGNIKHRPNYLCQCACGNLTIVEARSIASGRTKSCGCLRSVIGSCHVGYPYKHYIGKRFDRVVVLEYNYDHIGKGAYLLCQCDCGEKKVIPAKYLSSGQVKSCGCKLRSKIRRVI